MHAGPRCVARLLQSRSGAGERRTANAVTPSSCRAVSQAQPSSPGRIALSLAALLLAALAGLPCRPPPALPADKAPLAALAIPLVRCDGSPRPAWTPPPITFPIVWSSMAVLRTVSAVMVWEALGRQLLVGPLLLFMLHLAIGDGE